jgi:hypothetical protein
VRLSAVEAAVRDEFLTEANEGNEEPDEIYRKLYTTPPENAG